MAAVDGLADELLEAFFDSSPTIATLLGFSGPRDHLLPDYREAAEHAFGARVAEIEARAAAIDVNTLTPEERVTRAVVMRQAADMRTWGACRLAEFTICDSFTSPAADVLFTLPMTTMSTGEQADAYVDRLGAIPGLLGALAERHRAGIATGRLPVRHLVEAAAAHIERYLANADDPLRGPVPAGDSGIDVAAYSARRDGVIRDEVRPAYAAYRETLRTEIAPHSRDADHPGLCFLPDGEDCYRRLIAMHTTTRRSAEELHETGLRMVAQLAEEYREIGGRAFGTTKLPDIFDRLRNDPALRWRDGDELLDAARSAVARAEAAAPSWFGRLPDRGCEVRAVPADEAPGAAGAYYTPRAIDGSRPGIYFANTHEAQERDRTQSESTAFHEAVPGHHFQSSIAMELTGLPMLRRLAPFTAYTEGWGLYSERLAVEMGLYSDDIALLGMLSTDSLRAARLVVDTGMHAKGWSRAQAARYLMEQTPVMPIEVESEIDRYIAAPGQALAYMVGRLEIQRIRAAAEKALGPRFDIRGFHDVILGSGALPLSVLAELVDEWTAERALP
ncbi:DUF885 domain-containing protein [Rugosimonospora africana]|uniref:DUF885 domain-containing protein n=1 Tax=Rugosimonospora africana TaxID=556532 RepID=A0A8J3VR18_9ACTN|nr:DUF885 domain-containing protein [Rugosimonospora africana]GIH15086.1 hypothetical protein Raf01_32580 [Rugosimonospora africana]